MSTLGILFVILTIVIVFTHGWLSIVLYNDKKYLEAGWAALISVMSFIVLILILAEVYGGTVLS